MYMQIIKFDSWVPYVPRGQNENVGVNSVEILQDLWLDPSFASR